MCVYPLRKIIEIMNYKKCNLENHEHNLVFEGKGGLVNWIEVEN